jgi:hypothetical protein
LTDKINILANKMTTDRIDYFGQIIKSTKDRCYADVMKEFEEYTDDPQYVYKMCTDRYLVVLKKLDHTKTNESRKSDRKYPINPSCAKYRANILEVVQMIDILDRTCVDAIVNTITSSYKNVTTQYTVGHTVCPDSYDDCLENVCTNGIHYFKTPYRAYFYRHMPKNYTGIWFWWDDDGLFHRMCEYSDGKRSGRCLVLFANGMVRTDEQFIEDRPTGTSTRWRSDGTKTECTYKPCDDLLIVRRKQWYADGNIRSDGSWCDRVPVGIHYEWYHDGSLRSEEYYVDGQRIKKITEYPKNGTIKRFETNYTDSVAELLGLNKKPIDESEWNYE